AGGAKATAEKALPPAPKEAGKPAAEAAEAPAPQPAAQHFSDAAGSGNFTVQVGSYNDPSEANQRVSQLRAAGFEARAVEVELPKRGTWYRVQAGRFETREEATQAGAQMRARGAAAEAIVTEVGAK
ncbi:MAG: SPOR domain-containing protein, partial [Acidobacteriota bacterium]|nr:SPOR domain-containing protein [Acidobacteriota bacterium]